MPLRLLACVAPLTLAACSSPEEVREQTGVSAPTATATARATASATAGAGRAQKVEEDNDLYSYEFSFPAEVGAHPKLAALLEARAAKAKAEMIAQAREGQVDAKANGYPYNPHSYGAEWKKVADLPGYLSLSNEFYTFSGGAHGMYGVEGLVWDKANARSLAPEAMFVSTAALQRALGKPLCDALNRARVAKGIEPVAETGGAGVFPACPGLDEATILVGSANRRTFDRIGVYYGPYVAGSYAEGAYELDFPMTAAMIEAVKPAYRDALSAHK